MYLRARKCISCGKRLGPSTGLISASSSRCESCRKKVDSKLIIYKGMLEKFAENKYLTAENERVLRELRNEQNISRDDLEKYDLLYSDLKKRTRLRNIRLIEAGKYQEGKDISTEEYKRIEELKKNLDLSADEIIQTNRYIFYLTNLSLVEEGILPLADNLSLSLKKHELCYYRTFARMVIKRKAGWRADRTCGISVRLDKTSSYKYDKARDIRIADRFTPIRDNGYLYLTNQRIVFIGAQRVIEYPIKSLKFFVKYTDSVQFIKKRDKGSRFFLIEDQFTIDEIGAILLEIVKQWA